MGPENLNLCKGLGTLILLLWDLTLRTTALENGGEKAAHFENRRHANPSIPPTRFPVFLPPFLVSFLPGPTFHIRAQKLGWAGLTRWLLAATGPRPVV